MSVSVDVLGALVVLTVPVSAEMLVLVALVTLVVVAIAAVELGMVVCA